ncbi:MAG: DUF3696 domain-containing protein [Myxococcota bacterium]
MITQLAISNFKGITGDGIALTLAPVTLLFGANSAGKSTVLQALLYLHSILEHRSADTDTPTLRSRGCDFGDFRNIVHGRDLDRGIILTVAFTPSDDLKLTHLPYTYMAEQFIAEDLVAAVESAVVSIVVVWSELLSMPLVGGYSVGVNGEPFATLVAATDGSGVQLASVNEEHPLGVGLAAQYGIAHGCLQGEKHALPRWGQSLGIDTVDEGLDPGRTRFEAVVVGLGACLRDELARMLHVGPLRAVPPRGLRPPTHTAPAEWSQGLGAWHAATHDVFLAAKIGDWMQRIGTGYALTIASRRLVDEEGAFARLLARVAEGLEDPDVLLKAWQAQPQRPAIRVVDLETTTDHHPADLGVGIAQVVPVIAAAVVQDQPQANGRTGKVHLAAIEQPELHLHPAVQTGLGDLFAAAIRDETGERNERQFLIETHSEHLILRLLRRIRETTDGELEPDAPKLAPEDVAIYWAEKVDGAVVMKAIGVDADGEFTERWPKGFFAERLREL